MKTVSEVSQLTGVSVRTLHHYDKIGLLNPTQVGDNGYRYYDEEALYRLQEILVFRELDFPLKDIKNILASEMYSRQKAYSKHLVVLEAKRQRLDRIIAHVKDLQKEDNMTFIAYDDSELKVYQNEAKERWGNTSAYKTFEQKGGLTTDVMAEMTTIFQAFGALKAEEPNGELVQAKVVELQDYISEHFYPCTLPILSGLGQLYKNDSRFKQTIDHMGGEGTADFVAKAIHYVTTNKSK